MSNILMEAEADVAVKKGSNGAQKMLRKKAMSAPKALNEAYRYQKPSSFSRGMRPGYQGDYDPDDFGYGERG